MLTFGNLPKKAWVPLPLQAHKQIPPQLSNNSLDSQDRIDQKKASNMSERDQIKQEKKKSALERNRQLKEQNKTKEKTVMNLNENIVIIIQEIQQLTVRSSSMRKQKVEMGKLSNNSYKKISRKSTNTFLDWTSPISRNPPYIHLHQKGGD